MLHKLLDACGFTSCHPQQAYHDLLMAPTTASSCQASSLSLCVRAGDHSLVARKPEYELVLRGGLRNSVANPIAGIPSIYTFYDTVPLWDLHRCALMMVSQPVTGPLRVVCPA
jgi:hypothetical protein